MKIPKNISKNAQLIEGIGASSWFTIVAEKKLYSYALNKILSDITGDKYFYTDIL